MLSWFEGNSTVWIMTALLVASANVSSSNPPAIAPNSQPPAAVDGNASQAVSANFSVYSAAAAYDACDVAELCERWRDRLQDFWCGAPATTLWTPRCQIVVHPTRQDYLAAVGRGAARTLGTSWIEFSGVRVKTRRIDLLAEPGHGLSALPHELTHIVFADLFRGKQPPRWVDEGVAILADAPVKQHLHQRDFQRAFTQQAAFRCSELVSLDEYPSPHKIAAFYGQSASLVTFLAQRDDPAKFVAFIQRSMQRGYDQSLRDVYGINGLAEMERLWHAQQLGAAPYHGLQLTLDAHSPALSPAGAE